MSVLSAGSNNEVQKELERSKGENNGFEETDGDWRELLAGRNHYYGVRRFAQFVLLQSNFSDCFCNDYGLVVSWIRRHAQIQSWLAIAVGSSAIYIARSARRFSCSGNNHDSQRNNLRDCWYQMWF